MAHLVFIHASDGNNADLARLVEKRAQTLGHTVEHVSLNAYDFPVYTVKREQQRPPSRASATSSLDWNKALPGLCLHPNTTVRCRQFSTTPSLGSAGKAMIFVACSGTVRSVLPRIPVVADRMWSWPCANNSRTWDAM